MYLTPLKVLHASNFTIIKEKNDPYSQEHRINYGKINFC